MAILWSDCQALASQNHNKKSTKQAICAPPSTGLEHFDSGTIQESYDVSWSGAWYLNTGLGFLQSHQEVHRCANDVATLAFVSIVLPYICLPVYSLTGSQCFDALYIQPGPYLTHKHV